MEKLTLTAKSRTKTGKQVKTLRSAGELPAVVYGHGFDSKNITVNTGEFTKLYRRAGDSSLIDLNIAPDNSPLAVLIQDVSYNPLTDAPRHVDFRRVNMEEKLTAKIALKFVGESRAVKELGGIFVKNLSALEVECLPKDLVHEIEVNISPLAEFGNVIRLKDINLPDGPTPRLKAGDVIATVMPPRSEAELDALKGAVEEKVDTIKVVAEEKRAAEAAAKKAEEEAAA